MRHINRFIILLFISALGACATALHESRSDNEDRDIGLGGTGILAESGSGVGGTGIVGEITGFGSIFVNGIEIEYDDSTPVTINGQSSDNIELAIGDIVEVYTSDTKLYTQAKRINLRHEIIGRVEAIAADRSSITVLGHTIIIPDNIALPQAGKAVAVSGFRTAAKTIRATRITASNTDKPYIRAGIDLPYSSKVDQWLVQTYVHNGKASISLDGNVHTLNVDSGPSKKQSGIRVLKLRKAGARLIKLDQSIDPSVLPHGKQQPASIHDYNPAKLPRPAATTIKRHNGGTAR